MLTTDGKPLNITDYTGREYQLTYQGELLKSITDPAGRKVTYGNESGRLVKVTGPEGITTHYGYDTEGYLSEVRDGNNDRIEAITYQTTGKTTRVNQVTDAYGNRKSYTYDDVNGKTTITDSKGVTTTQWYDTTYNITNSSDGEGRLTTAVYTTQDGVNKYGEVKSTTDRNGNTTSYEYDSRGNTIRITNPDSSYRQYTYNGKNRITSEREEAGKFTYYIYDETDTLLLKVVRPLNGTDVYSEAAHKSKFAITNYSYYALGEKGHTIRGLVKSITDPEGNITAYTYDAYGNVATVTNPEGNKTTYTNNILGLPTVILSPKGEKTTISYNDKADPVKEVKAGQETTQMFYDNLGRKIQELTPNLSRMISESTGSEGYRYTYYPSGSLQSVTDPEDNITTYTYDLYGNIQTETRPDGSIQCYEYDTLNRVIKEYFQDSKTSERSLQKSYAYSILSNKNTQTTETVYLNRTETAVTVKVYDYAGRQTKQTNPDGGITGAVYNSNGTLYSATDAMDKLTYYRYDGLNRIAQQWTPFESGKYTYSAYTYDKNGNKLTESIGIEAVSQWGIPATLLTTVYEYDGNNLVTKAIDAAGGTTSYEYDENGNLSREIADMNGMISHETAYQHNHLGKVETETRYAKAGDIYGNAAGSTAETLLETVHTYDANGNVLTITTPDGITTAYEYDKLDRPVAQTVQGLDEYGHPADITTTTAYDYAGNIVSTTDANGNTTRNTYNAKGLLIRSVDAEGGITLHEYDNAGRRTATITPENYVEGTDVNGMSRAVFTYDTMGRIILEQDIYYDKAAGAWNTINAKAYRYDKNGRLLKELDALGYESGAGSTIADRINNGYGTVNTYNDAGLLLSTQAPASKEKGISYDVRYTYDAAGRKITETNAKGVVTTHTYDNMGRVLKTSVQDGTAKTIRQVTYDRLGNILTESDGKGNTTTYIYNRVGLVKSKTTPGDATIPSNMTVYQYDKLGRQVHQEDDLGKEIIITYNHNGQILTQTEQREDATQRNTISNDYDKNGNLRFATDANGVTTEQTFDRLNWVVRTCLTVGGTEQATTYTYDKNGNQLTTTDWLGNTYTNEYDTLNRLIKKSDSYGAVIERYEYNNNHVQVKAIDALDNETTFAYDRNNRLLRTTDPEGNITSQTYDAVGNTATKTDGKGKAAAYEYDALNRLVKVTNAKGGITAYTYDLNGNMLTKKDGRSNTVTYTYNVANLLVTEADPAGVKESYVYYADGMVRSKTDKLGSILTYTYDIHGNLLTEAADGPGSMGVLEYNYTYDANGNMLTMTDSTGTTRRTYDELGRVLTKTVPVIGTVSFTYDIRTGAGEGCHRERTKDPKGNITIKEYDKTGRLIKVIAGSDTVTYTYYANGSRESVTYNDGTKEEYTYNANSQIKTLINRRADGSILDSYTYTYDAAGNQLTKNEIITGVEKGTTTYTYDDLNRLLTVTEPSGKSTSYEYDKAGNRSKETILSIASTTGSTVATVNTYTYDTRNRLTELGTRVNNVLIRTTGYTYDNNGNQLTTVVKSYTNGTTAASTITTLTNTYDLHNQLIRSITENGTTINNSYNAEGYRVGKEVITGEGGREYTRYLYEADKVILETTETGSQKARNIYGTNLLMRITGSTAYQYLYNGHADITALLTREGAIAATYYYDAFGNILESTGNVDNSIRYAGYQYDIETGLYYLNARMYDPVTARFLQEDSYKGDPKDPLSLNLYTYCHNNPITYDDPTGHWLHIIAGTLIGGLLGGVIDAGSQMLFEKKSFKEINWKSVGVSAIEGAITGAIGAATGGASLAASAGKEAVKQTGKQIVKKIAATAITEGIVGAGANAAAQYAVAGKVDTGQVLLTGVMDTITAGAGSAVPYTKLGKKLNMVGEYISSKTDTMVKNIQSTFSPQLSPKAALAGGVELDPHTLFSSTDISSPAVMKNTTQTNFNEVYHSRNSSIVDATDSINKGGSQAVSPYSDIPDGPKVGEGKNFTKSQKDKIIAQNRMNNGGVVKSDLSGEVLVQPQKSTTGVTPNPLEWQIDHIKPKSKGGLNSHSNSQVLSRAENRLKSNK